MIIAASACFIAGTLLGMRFRVAILLPAMLGTAAAILCLGILGGQKTFFIIVSQILALTALQFGYLSAAFMDNRPARKIYQPGAIAAHDPR